MKSETIIDPGILLTFRRANSARIAIFLFTVIIFFWGAGLDALQKWLPLTIMLVDCVMLQIYLYLPSARTILKNSYLPIGIIWATAGPMIELFLLFSTVTRAEPSAFLLLLQSMLVLFIPLVITAWRYSLRAIVIYCGSTFLLDGLLIVIILVFFPNTYTGRAFFPPLLGMSFTRTVILFFVGNLIVNLMKVQREQQQSLVDANQQLTHYAATIEQLTTSRERNRVARELHDLLAHTMSGVAVELEGVRAMMYMDIDQAEAMLGQSLKAIREGLSETRRALQALRASPLEDLGLGLAVQNLVETIAGRSGLKTDVMIEKELPDYPIEVQQSFYRVAQEALTNIVNHAKASRVVVCLLREGQGVKLIIRDNGVGFDEKSVDLQQKYGLLGIRERGKMINGQVSITSQIGKGTEIVFRYGAMEMED